MGVCFHLTNMVLYIGWIPGRVGMREAGILSFGKFKIVLELDVIALAYNPRKIRSSRPAFITWL